MNVLLVILLWFLSFAAVADNGIGTNPDTDKAIFEAFVQGHLREHETADKLRDREKVTMEALLTERFVTQEKALQLLDRAMTRFMDEFNVRLTERFAAQRKAIAASDVAENQLRTSRDDLFSERFDSQEKAVLKAEAAAERRFASVNEFRQTLSDQAAQLISRAEVGARLDAVNAKIDAGLATVSKEASSGTSRLDRIEGESGGISNLTGALIAGAGLLMAIISIVVMLVMRNTQRGS